MMKRVRKGFTLVELLIVLAVLGSLSSMMAYSSSGAVDSADTAKILGDLQTLKMAAMQMYMEEPEVASLSTIALDGSTTIGTGDDAKTVASILGAYLGKKADALLTTTGDSAHTSKYGLVGSSTAWYVAYKLDASDSTGVRAKLKDRAEACDLYGVATVTTTGDCGFANYYTNAETAGSDFYIALKVR